MMVVAPEQEEKNARAPPYTHLLKFFFKGVDGLLNQDEDPQDGLLNQDEDPPTKMKIPQGWFVQPR